jgi:TatD DNase family protein
VTAGGGWFDAHCHLQEEYLGGRRGQAGDGDVGDGAPEGAGLAAALARAAAAGVGSLVCVGTGVDTSVQAIELAGAARRGDLGAGVPRIWATAGLHPHQAATGTGGVVRLVDETMAGERDAAGRPPAGGRTLVAVGECGLDYHYDHSPRPAQRAAFAEQIALAHRHGLTLVIHARDAWDDLFGILAAERVPDRTVLHCFTGGPDEARACLDAGMYVSFSGIVTFKNAGDVREAVALCPLDRLLIETDSPFLAPAPHRGRPNEPSLVPLVGAAVAEVKGVDTAEVARLTSANSVAAFAI